MSDGSRNNCCGAWANNWCVQGDVALAGLLFQQRLGQLRRVRVGVADQQPAPTAVHGAWLIVRFAAISSQTRLQALVGGRLTAQQALFIGTLGFHRIRFLVR